MAMSRATAVSGSASNAAQMGQTGTVSGGGIALSDHPDSKTDSTAPKFSEVLNNIQSQFGAKPEKPREIKKVLGKDDFLKIMISQMKNQDPTSPFKAEQMASEMAQFASVEQLQNINSNIGKLALQNQPSERMALTNLIGKTITVDRERFAHVENVSDSIGFTLPKDASKVTVHIVSDRGEPILSRELGARKKGDQTFSWDGVKGNSMPALTGNYFMKVDARDEHDVKMGIQTQGKARVVGVSFEGTEPSLLIGDRANQQKITMKNIIKIETEDGGDLVQRQPIQAGIEPTAKAGPNPSANAPMKPPSAPFNGAQHPVSTGASGPAHSLEESLPLSDRLNMAARTRQVPGSSASNVSRPEAVPISQNSKAAPTSDESKRDAESVAAAAANAPAERGFPHGLTQTD